MFYSTKMHELQRGLSEPARLHRLIDDAPYRHDGVSAWIDWALSAHEQHDAARFSHVRTCVERARGCALREDQQELLLLAAACHDLGKVVDERETLMHGVRAAEILRALGQSAVAPICAHHSGALAEARLRGVADMEWWATEPVPTGPLHALDAIDATTDNTGEVVSLDARLADILARYGDEAVQTIVFKQRLDGLRPLVAALPDGDGLS